jgi:hypothetical protein
MKFFSQPDVLPMAMLQNFVTDYFPLKIKILAERKREFTAKLINIARK